MLPVVLDVVIPLGIGAIVGRKLPVVAVVVVLGSVVIWWPENDSGDDSRPYVYPFAMAWLAAFAVAGASLPTLFSNGS